MNKKQKFKSFLESLKDNGQDTLIEIVKQGFKSCFENEELNEELNDDEKIISFIKNMKGKNYFVGAEGDYATKANIDYSQFVLNASNEYPALVIMPYNIAGTYKDQSFLDGKLDTLNNLSKLIKSNPNISNQELINEIKKMSNKGYDPSDYKQAGTLYRTHMKK